MNLASCTNFVRRLSFIFIFWLTTANGFEPPAALLQNTVPNSIRESSGKTKALENTLVMSHPFMDAKYLES